MDKKSIIELLGIKPIQRIDNPDTMTLLEIREVEKQRNELLEALIFFYRSMESFYQNTVDNPWFNEIKKMCIPSIEKACFPLKWSEIKEIINAE